MIGLTVLHYTITAELGTGSVGRVYLAADQHTGRRVALKFLDPSLCTADAIALLSREARAVSRLSHRGIVTLYGLEDAGERWFLIEEFIEGETLASRLKRGPLGTQDVLRLAREVTAALGHAHAHGVLHRDLKPANILIAVDGTFKITDFGIARVEGVSTPTDSGVVGTLPYTAPERVRGSRGDARADLFSLGAIFYEAMTGRLAFGGSSEAEIIYSLLNQEPPKAVVRTARLERFAGLVDRLLSKEPGDRPASAELVGGLLDGLERDLAPSRRRSGWPRAAAVLGLAVMLIAVAVVLLWPKSEWGATGPVMVMQFQNVPDPADSSRLGLIASSLLVNTLAQQADLNVLSSESTLDAQQELGVAQPATNQVARRVARRTGAGCLVTGNILRISPTFLVTAEVSVASTGHVLGAVKLEGLPGQTVFDVIDTLGRQLLPVWTPPPARRFGDRFESRRGTSDLGAYKSYVGGLEYMARGELGKAETMFTIALRLDPEFEQAQTQLALVQWRRSRPGMREAP